MSTNMNFKPAPGGSVSRKPSALSRESTSSVVTCPICWEDLVMEKRALFTTDCGHKFHFSCIQVNFVGGNLLCPMCRAHFKEPPVILQDRTMNAKWYWNDISRERAEALLLQDGTDGCFLVRESTSMPGKY
ncbi:hypothetical protein SARC_14395, partial [Sphaeroforma arctica JP610]